jgi:hypothetical protein
MKGTSQFQASRVIMSIVTVRIGFAKNVSAVHGVMDITMAFCGCTGINTVDKSILLPGSYPT